MLRRIARRGIARTIALTTVVAVMPFGASTMAASDVAPSAVSGTVSGTVFEDRNGDGFFDAAGDMGVPEIGVAGAEVRAYDSTGALVSGVSAVVSGSDGTYSLTITNAATDDLRIEFTTPPGYSSAPAAAGGGTSVQFRKVDDENVDYGVLVPNNFCGDNPQTNPGIVVATCFYPGAREWAPGAYNRGTVKYTAWNSDDSDVGEDQQMAANADTGALWGLGNQRSTGLIFTSAVVRRHSDLGPQGLAGIYVLRAGETGVVESYDLATLYAGQGVQFTDDTSKWTRANRDIATPASPTDPTVSNGLSRDIPGWDGVGKEGIGDIDVSDDGQFLWVVNLYEKTLLRITLDGTRADPNLGTLVEYAIPSDICQLTGSNERPWAVDPRPDGTVRVGVVCDNAGAQDSTAEFDLANLSEGAKVLELNATGTTWSTLLSVDLASRTRYDRACGLASGVGNPVPEDGKCWGAWLAPWSNYTNPTLIGLLPQHELAYPVWQYGQPMLVDIESLSDGSMVLNFNDRTSMQFGSKNMQPAASQEQTWLLGDDADPTFTYMTSWVMGDTILACSLAGGGWAVETNGACAGVTNYNGMATDDPGSSAPYGEFFQDSMSDAHFEVTSGGLATMPSSSGTPVIGSAVMDPCDVYSGGVRWWSTQAGNQTACAVYTGARNEEAAPVSFGKSTSMGDMESLCDSAPIEIGNRLWIDTDEDGVQDPGEAPIAGVTLHLYDAQGTVVGTAVTNEYGEYYFTSQYPLGDDDTSNAVGGGVLPYQAYTIRIDNPDDWASGGVLDSAFTTLTSTNSTAPNGAQSDAVDNDFSIVDGYPELSVPAKLPGESDHTYDGGIISDRQPVVAVGDYTWIDADRDGIQDDGEDPLEGVYVELLNPDGTQATDANGDPVDGVYTDASGYYFFDNLLPGDYRMRFTLPDGYAFTTPTSDGSTSANDSDAVPTDDDPFVGLTDTFTIESSATGDTEADVDDWYTAEFFNPTIDAGVVPIVVALGNYTWIDYDRDGVQDSNEPSLRGVLVELFDANGDPAVDADGNPVEAVLTDANGYYLFDNLLPGEYSVCFTPPEGYSFTMQYSSTGDEANDSNASQDDGCTDVFSVVPGDGVTEVDTDPDTIASFVNPTIDAGFVPGGVSVGDYVWYDANLDGRQDPTDVPLAGVVLTITKADGSPVTDINGNLVGPTTTDANGLYSFDLLPFGQYRVFVQPPSGYKPTNPGVGDGVGDSATDTALSLVLTVDGDRDATLDFGFVLVSEVLPPTGGSPRLSVWALHALLFGALMVTARRRRRVA